MKQVKRGLVAAVGFAAVAATVVLAGASSAATSAPKVNVCHVGANGAPQLTSVDASTLAAHLRHGDARPGVMALPAGTTFNASTTNSHAGGTVDHAFDGDKVMGWNSGLFPMQWIEVNFGSPQPFSKITGIASQDRPGTTRHSVTLDGAPAFSWSGPTVDSQLLTHTFAKMQYAQTVRITTTSSPSWVAWREIQLIGCSASTVVKPVVSKPVAQPTQIRPQDQSIAERLTLKRSDLGSGWREARPGSRKFESVDRSRPGCSSAPRIDQSITGFYQSPTFREVGRNEVAWSHTRIFESVALAKRWFDWTRSANSAKCRQNYVAGLWQQDGYKVTRSTGAGQSFVVRPCECLPHSLQAWAFTRTVEKAGDKFTQYEIYVTVRIQNAVVRFGFWDYDRPPTYPEGYVISVLQRVSR